MSLIMKVPKQKLSKTTEEWVEPEPIVQTVAGSTGYPFGTPPPQKLLPKSKRRHGPNGLNGIVSHVSAFAKRSALSRERHSRSAESEEASKSPDEYEYEGGLPKNSQTSSGVKSNSETPSETPNEEQPPSPGVQKSIKEQLATKLLTHITESITQPSCLRRSLISSKPEIDESRYSHIPAFKREPETKHINGRRSKRQNGVMAAKRIRSIADDSPPPASGRKRQKRGHGAYVLLQLL